MWSVHIFHSFSSEWRFACARNDCREGMSIVFLNTKLKFTHHCNFHPYIPSRRLSRGNVKFFFRESIFFLTCVTCSHDSRCEHMLSNEDLHVHVVMTCQFFLKLSSWAHVVSKYFLFIMKCSIIFEVVVMRTCSQSKIFLNTKLNFSLHCK